MRCGHFPLNAVAHNSRCAAQHVPFPLRKEEISPDSYPANEFVSRLPGGSAKSPCGGHMDRLGGSENFAQGNVGVEPTQKTTCQLVAVHAAPYSHGLRMFSHGAHGMLGALVHHQDYVLSLEKFSGWCCYLLGFYQLCYRSIISGIIPPW